MGLPHTIIHFERWMIFPFTKTIQRAKFWYPYLDGQSIPIRNDAGCVHEQRPQNLIAPETGDRPFTAPPELVEFLPQLLMIVAKRSSWSIPFAG